jgi:hypothetical protein
MSDFLLNILHKNSKYMSQDSSVSIKISYELDDWISTPGKVGILLYGWRQNGSEAHRDPNPMVTGDKAAVEWNWSLNYIQCRDYECMELYLYCTYVFMECCLITSTDSQHKVYPLHFLYALVDKCAGMFFNSYLS